MLLGGLLFFTPLIAAPSLMLDQYNMPKFALLAVGVSTATGLRFLELGIGRRRFLTIGLATPAMVATVPLVLAWAASPYRGWALWGQFTRLQGLIPYLIVVAFGVLLVDAFADRPRMIALAVAGSGAAAGGVAIYQMLFIGSEIGAVSTSGYVTSTLGHSNFAGGFLAITLPVAVILWLDAGRWKWVAVAGVAVTAAGLLFTFSQGGWVAAIAGIAVGVGIYASGTRPGAVHAGVGAAALIAAASIGLVIVSASSEALVHRYPGVTSSQTRGFLWMQALELTAERPALGWGPNVFALEALSRRGIQESLFGASSFGDDPHSVPLAMAANAGLVGVAGYLFLLGWPVVRWRRARRHLQSSRLDVPLAAAFGGGLAAYAVQATVSLDEVALRTMFWACLAGFAASVRPHHEAAQQRDVAAPNLHFAIAAAACAFAAAVWLGATLAPADHLSLSGARSITRGDVPQGARDAERAIALRDAFEYRRAYATALGRRALEEGRRGGPLIRAMRVQYGNLRERGDPLAAREEAGMLFDWSRFDPQLREEALRLYRAARAADGFNPVLATRTADVLLSLGRYEDAVATLRPFVPLLTEQYPQYKLFHQEFWGGLAAAEALVGNRIGAERAIAISRMAVGDECRTWIAEELLKPPHTRERPAGIGFLCPTVLLELLPDPVESDAAGA